MSWMLSCIGCGTKKLPEREEARFLDFQHCLLKTVPFEVFQNERILQELILDSNQISELPRELFHCHELCILSLSDNELQTIPSAISSLINLQSLNFCKNGISDIPDSIKACKKLARVDASTNPLCRIPEGVSQLVALRELSLNDTFLDYLPANFGRLTGLEVLELRENQLNTLPRSMTRLTALRRLDLGQNEYSELPEVVGHLTSLTDLWFDGNKIKSIPLDIGNLIDLKFIDASRNRIREICPEIGDCKELVDLHLNSNELELLPDEICQCQQLSTLCLDENLIGQLPDNLGELDRLTELNISHNELVELPSSVGLLRELRVLHIDHNLLTELPPDLGSCAQLIILTAAHNQITFLPPELANIYRLRVINVCGNQIEFLPVSFTKLQVTGLWLSENQTKPTVPMQCKIDSPTGQKVLTCYMLPQLPYEEKEYKDDSNDLPLAEADVTRRRAKSLIHFASDKDNETKGLSRIPTPYPKELRALARHTKNLKSLNKANGSSRNEMVPTISPVSHKQDPDKAEEDADSLTKISTTKFIPTEAHQVEDLLLTGVITGTIPPSTTIENNSRVPIKEVTETPMHDEIYQEESDFLETIKEKDKLADSFQKPEKIKDESDIPPGEKPDAVPDPPEAELREGGNADIHLNNSNLTKETFLLSVRPASIAVPEVSKLEESLENDINPVGVGVNWHHQRPGSLATPTINSDSVYQPQFTYLSFSNKFEHPSPTKQDAGYLRPSNAPQQNEPHVSASAELKGEAQKQPLLCRTPIDDNGSGGAFATINPLEILAAQAHLENVESFPDEEDSVLDNSSTRTPCYAPQANSCYSPVQPEILPTTSEYTPSKSIKTKVAYQSRLPTLGTPNKPAASSSVAETADGKTRIPTPGTKALRSPRENISSPNSTKKSADSSFTMESRIPSFSAKHSAFGMSPVEKPINTSGIPAISPSSRDSVINSSLKKKSGIPLSKSKPTGHRVSPAEKGLKSPHGSNHAWK